MASGMAVTAELESWSCFWRLLISSVTAGSDRSNEDKRSRSHAGSGAEPLKPR